MHVGDRLVRAAGLAAGEAHDRGVAVEAFRREVEQERRGVGVDGELEQGGEPGGTVRGRQTMAQTVAPSGVFTWMLDCIA